MTGEHKTERLCRALGSVGLAADAQERVVDALLNELGTRVIRRGETLIREREHGEEAHVLLSGRLVARVRDEDGEIRLVGEILPGELLGEVSLVHPGPRTATLIAARDSEIVTIPRDVFLSLLEHHPSLALGIAGIIIARWRRSTSGYVRQSPRVIALVPAGSTTGVFAFEEALSRALLATGRSVARASVSDHLDQLVLEELETANDYVLLSMDGVASPRNDLCLAHADSVLLVADVGRAPTPPNAVERAALQILSSEAPPSAALVLYGDARAAGGAMREWLVGRSVARHHHVIAGSSASLGRFVRQLTLEATGLVLGGGGARGVAHLGAIRALAEAGIPIDAVGGTSFGALVGAALAMGWDHRQMTSAFRTVLVERGSFFDYTAPFVAMTSGNRLVKILERVYGQVDIEDLELPFFCIASNLSRSAPVTISSGRLTDALRASVSIPGIFPPVVRDRDLLVDGGLTNNLPVQAMHDRVGMTGRVLASDVTGRAALSSAGLKPDGTYSGWAHLVARLNPFRAASEVPTLFGILTACVSVAGGRSLAYGEDSIDLCFQPPVQGYGLLDWSAFDELVEVGYRHACERLERCPPDVRR